MAKEQALRKEADPREPVNIGGRAIDNLKFIRETMERSTHFTAVPGYGGILMGLTAIAAAYIAQTQPAPSGWLVTWFAEVVLAFSIGMITMWQKSRIVGTSMASTPAKKFALGFAPPLFAGVAITLGLARYEHWEVMAPVCMITYGAAVVCGGAYSVKVVPVMGWCFMALGALAFALPAHYGNLLMAASFGGLHIVFGAIIARKHGG